MSSETFLRVISKNFTVPCYFDLKKKLLLEDVADKGTIFLILCKTTLNQNEVVTVVTVEEVVLRVVVVVLVVLVVAVVVVVTVAVVVMPKIITKATEALLNLR